MNNKNSLMTKKNDLLQRRADALDQATKAFGGDKAVYESKMADVEAFNKELETMDKLLSECDRFGPADDGSYFKGAQERGHQSGVLLVDKICGTEQYANSWLESVKKHISVDRGRDLDSLAPLYEAEKAMKALTITGSDGADGGFLVPTEFNNMVTTLSKDYLDLSTLVNVEHVHTQSGWRAVETAGAQALAKVGEMAAIQASSNTPKFAKVTYNCEKYADKLPISNELMADATALLQYLAKWWAPKYIMTKNALILAVLNTIEFGALEGATDAEKIKALKTLINTGLRTATARRAVILTNALGYNEMDGWADSTGRPMLVQDPKDGEIQRFKNKPIHYADVDEIPDITEVSQYHPLYVGDLKAACTLFIRQGVRVKSTDVGGDAWDTDSTEIRCTCRMDAEKVDGTAVKRTGFAVGA